jgi:hypothetical protein
VSTLAVSDSCGAPVFSLRCLARIGSEPGGVSPEGLKEDIVRERHQLWVEAQHQRKRFCRYVLCTSNTKERLDAVVNEAHRAYVLSCDLLQELEAQPWSTFTYSNGSCVRRPPGLLDIKAIVDVSPGSGQLGIAALNLGVSYVGVCCDERHMSLLTNIADRDALRSIGE